MSHKTGAALCVNHGYVIPEQGAARSVNHWHGVQGAAHSVNHCIYTRQFMLACRQEAHEEVEIMAVSGMAGQPRGAIPQQRPKDRQEDPRVGNIYDISEKQKNMTNVGRAGIRVIANTSHA